MGVQLQKLISAKARQKRRLGLGARPDDEALQPQLENLAYRALPDALLKDYAARFGQPATLTEAALGELRNQLVRLWKRAPLLRETPPAPLAGLPLPPAAPTTSALHLLHGSKEFRGRGRRVQPQEQAARALSGIFVAALTNVAIARAVARSTAAKPRVDAEDVAAALHALGRAAYPLDDSPGGPAAAIAAQLSARS